MTAMIRLLGAAVVLASAAPTLAAQAPDGAALYREHCKECHGAAGRPTKQALGKYKDIKPFEDLILDSWLKVRSWPPARTTRSSPC